MKKQLVLSLILACYNEGPTFKKSLEKIIDVLDNINYSYEVICIDDKSDDTTSKILDTFIKEINDRKKWRVFFHEKNIGRGATVKEGMLKAKGEIVGYIDVDLEVSAIYIPEFVHQINNGSDIAIATRVYQIAFSNLIRAFSTIIYTVLSRLVLKHSLKDTEAGYKFFSRKKILPILKKCQNNHWFFDTEILIRSLDHELKIKEIPVLFLRRQDKKSTVKLIPDTWKYFIALKDFKSKR